MLFLGLVLRTAGFGKSMTAGADIPLAWMAIMLGLVVTDPTAVIYADSGDPVPAVVVEVVVALLDAVAWGLILRVEGTLDDYYRDRELQARVGIGTGLKFPRGKFAAAWLANAAIFGMNVVLLSELTTS